MKSSKTETAARKARLRTARGRRALFQLLSERRLLMGQADPTSPPTGADRPALPPDARDPEGVAAARRFKYF